VGTSAGLDGCGKSRPHRNFFFVFPCTLYFIRACFFVWIRTRNPSKRSAADPRLRPLGHWDRHSIPGQSSPQRVAIPTELPRPIFTQRYMASSYICSTHKQSRVLKIKTEGTTRGKTRLLRVKQDKDKRLCVYSARTSRGAGQFCNHCRGMEENGRESEGEKEKETETEHVILI
jgi:hypothetical protein